MSKPMNAIELAEALETRWAEALDCESDGAGDDCRASARLLREMHEALCATDDLVRECRNPVPDPVFRKHLADRAFTALESFRRARQAYEAKP